MTYTPEMLAADAEMCDFCLVVKLTYPVRCRGIRSIPHKKWGDIMRMCAECRVLKNGCWKSAGEKPKSTFRRKKTSRPTLESVSLDNRFWSKVEKTDGCWNWQASRAQSGTGYGNFYYMGHTWHAHRLSWIAEYGSIPVNMDVCHHCDNVRCVRPSHLFLDTPSENLLDCVRKGRIACSNRKLEPHQVLEIRALALQGESHISISRRFGMSRPAISDIIRGRKWKNLVQTNQINQTK